MDPVTATPSCVRRVGLLATLVAPSSANRGFAEPAMARLPIVAIVALLIALVHTRMIGQEAVQLQSFEIERLQDRSRALRAGDRLPDARVAINGDTLALDGLVDQGFRYLLFVRSTCAACKTLEPHVQIPDSLKPQFLRIAVTDSQSVLGYHLVGDARAAGLIGVPSFLHVTQDHFVQSAAVESAVHVARVMSAFGMADAKAVEDYYTVRIAEAGE